MLKFKKCVGIKDNYIARNGKYTFYIDENFVVNIDKTKINSVVVISLIAQMRLYNFVIIL